MSLPARTRLTREESQEQTRQRLIDAACIEVAKRGFAAASVRDIAEAAGYSQGAFYSNFDSKESLMLELMRRHKTEQAKRLVNILDGAENDAKAALAGLEQWAATLKPDPDRAMLAIELELHAKRNPAFAVAYDAMIQENRNAFAHLLARLFKMHGLKPPAPTADLAIGVMALTYGLILSANPTDSATPGSILITFIRALLAAGGKKR